MAMGNFYHRVVEGRKRAFSLYVWMKEVGRKRNSNIVSSSHDSCFFFLPFLRTPREKMYQDLHWLDDFTNSQATHCSSPLHKKATFDNTLFDCNLVFQLNFCLGLLHHNVGRQRRWDRGWHGGMCPSLGEKRAETVRFWQRIATRSPSDPTSTGGVW